MINKIDWLKKDQRTFLERGYLAENESPEQRYQTICDTIQNIVNSYDSVDEKTLGIGERFEKYIENNWISFATPVLRNFGAEYGLPISCNKSIMPDSLEGISSTIMETMLLAKHGAGTAIDFSYVRPIGSDISTGGKSNSVMDWIELAADAISKTNQSSARRGFLTAYLRLDHPEIMEFLKIGTHKMPEKKQRFFQTITTGVVIPPGWRDGLMNSTEKKKIFSEVLNSRSEIGYPYIFDMDNANNNAPKYMQDKGYIIKNSNICNETAGFTDENTTFACCLSSVNAARFDEWKDDPNFLFDCYVMLDCVVEEYIQKASNLIGFERALNYAKNFRGVGLGVFGFHSLLQKNMVPLGSLESYRINNEVFKALHEAGNSSSRWMAQVWGEAPAIEGYGYRNTQRQAIAPTKSTAFIMGGVEEGYSEGIETHKSNYMQKKFAKLQVTFKNKDLEKLLIQKGKNTDDIWDSILVNNGSVQHLDFLSDLEKDVFKTSSEISQVDIIKMAGQRQPYITQGQSVNLMIHPETPKKDLIKLHLQAFDEEGLKGLYYQYSINAVQQFRQDLLTCSSCEG